MRSAIAFLSFLTVPFALISCSPIQRDETGGNKGAQPAHALAHGKSASLTRANGDAVFNLEYLGAVESPIAKQPVELPADFPVVFSGWAIDEENKKAAAGVDVAVDGYPYGAAYGSSRADVAEHFKMPDSKNSGFKVSIPVADIGKGHHEALIRVFSNDGKTYWEGLPIEFDIK